MSRGTVFVLAIVVVAGYLLVTQQFSPSTISPDDAPAGEAQPGQDGDTARPLLGGTIRVNGAATAIVGTGAPVWVQMTLRNDSDTMRVAVPRTLAPRWSGNAGEVQPPMRALWRLPRQIAPGASVELAWVVVAVPVPGEYQISLDWTVLRAGGEPIVVRVAPAGLVLLAGPEPAATIDRYRRELEEIDTR